MTLSIVSVSFIVSVLFIALTCWYLRSRIESDPEPFFLGLTFFAFAGQFIRSVEWTSKTIWEGRVLPGLGWLLFLLGIAGATVVLQAFVLKVHMQITRVHYCDLLRDAQIKPNPTRDHQIESWADVLLRLTGVDFFPGGYQWLRKFFPTQTEPRERSRRLAVSVLPPKEFRIKSGGVTGQKEAGNSLQASGGESQRQLEGITSETPNAITPELLVVPPTIQRQVYWWLYVLLCFLSWVWFVSAIMISQEHVTAPK